MATIHRHSILRRTLAVLAAPAVLAGCASTQLDGQWLDPQVPAQSLRGARVMVACEAYDVVVKRLCQDQMAAELVARGATAVSAPDTGNPAPGRPLGPDQYLEAARSAGAKAVWTSYITPSATGASPAFSVGIGGFGMGGGGHIGGGVGVSAPIGGGQMTIGYSADCRLSDAKTGRVMWTAKATSPPSSDLGAQLQELTRTVFGAVDKAQLF
ncbi:MAG TPA: hypothetical protein VJ743_04750 [Albitalea sp.]|nr:hypothetical protein [Albitalea sp.]